MIDTDLSKYPYIPNKKGFPSGAFDLPDGKRFIEAGSGRSLIVASSPGQLAITDAEDWLQADDFEIKKPRALVAEIVERNGNLGIVCELIVRIPEEPEPHPDFFAVQFAIKAKERFERIHRKRVVFLEGDYEETSKNWQQHQKAKSEGRTDNAAFWLTSAGQGSIKLGFPRLEALVKYKDAKGLMGFSFRTGLPTPTPWSLGAL